MYGQLPGIRMWMSFGETVHDSACHITLHGIRNCADVIKSTALTADYSESPDGTSWLLGHYKQKTSSGWSQRACSFLNLFLFHLLTLVEGLVFCCPSCKAKACLCNLAVRRSPAQLWILYLKSSPIPVVFLSAPPSFMFLLRFQPWLLILPR